MRAWLLLALLVASAALLWRLQTEADALGRSIAKKTTAGVDIDSRLSEPIRTDESSTEIVPAIGSSGQRDQSLVDLALSALHAVQDPRPCLAGTASQVKTEKLAIHRWVDAAGILHFSDQPPVGQATSHRRIEVDGLPAIVVKASGYDVNLPEFVAQRAVADAQAIERVLRRSLGVDGDPGLVLDIEFIESAETYAQRVGNPLMVGSEGTYSPADHTIHVRLQDRKEANFLILRHEITHALIHERIGNLPTALNEGMAGFFERVEVSGLGARVVLDETTTSLRDAVVATDGRDELVDLLARDGAEFYAAGREQRYLRAFALIAVLMGTPDGRDAMSAVLAAQRSAPCRPVAAERLLDSGYPGGLAALAADWARWLRDPPKSVQAF